MAVTYVLDTNAVLYALGGRATLLTNDQQLLSIPEIPSESLVLHDA